MINLSTETILPLSLAAKRVPASRNGRKTHLSTLLRWILQGVDGIRLEGVRLGGRWVTSQEALQRFAEALTPDLTANPRTSRSPGARERADDRARRQLDQIGI
jgi:hypothetical protein